jgi:flagellar P-ring protein precursor FlgI
MRHTLRILSLLLLAVLPTALHAASGIRLKDLSRMQTERPNMLVGYGVVTGLAGTGDSPNSKLTNQSISNVLGNLGVNIAADAVRSRNVAVVMITTSLPRYSQPGDLLDVNVTSMGDARSLVGGTLLMTPLKGPDSQIHALAQGALSVGGYKYDLNGNIVQKNHPTAGNIPNGATVEMAAPDTLLRGNGVVQYVLYEPDMTTVNRIVQTINATYGQPLAAPIDPGRYEVRIPDGSRNGWFDFLARTESLVITPDVRARVVVNERTGTVVSGGDVNISQTTISHGDLIVAITTDYQVSQPSAYFGSVNSPDVRTQVVPQTTVKATELAPIAVNLPKDTTVAELVAALNRVKASSRDIITILQGLKTAGALHAELVIQ